MAVWHYTVGIRYQLIERDGVIKPATAFVPQGEKPIVWFSLNQQWEKTADKSVKDEDGTLRHLNTAETAEVGGGLVRIGVAPETAPHDWKTLRELSGMTSAMAQGMYHAAIDKGARPGEWRGTFQAVPRSKWTAIEIFENGEWVPQAAAQKGKG